MANHKATHPLKASRRTLQESTKTKDVNSLAKFLTTKEGVIALQYVAFTISLYSASQRSLKLYRILYCICAANLRSRW